MSRLLWFWVADVISALNAVTSKCGSPWNGNVMNALDMARLKVVILIECAMNVGHLRVAILSAMYVGHPETAILRIPWLWDTLDQQ